jgi:hypothetical protein
VRKFHSDHRLGEVMELELLIRGAHLARNNMIFEKDEEIGPDHVEREALEREKQPKLFQQPKALLVVLWTCCIGAIVQ